MHHRPTGDGLIVLPAEVVEAILVHARHEYPREACGLIAGAADHVTFVYPLTNTARRRDRFTIGAVDHYGAVTHAERMGWDIVGVFHSHPDGVAELSPMDVAQPHDPAWLHLIVGVGTTGPGTLTAWRIEGSNAVEVAYQVGP